MLVETLIQNTLEMQGFRVAEVTFVNRSGPGNLNKPLSGKSATF